MSRRWTVAISPAGRSPEKIQKASNLVVDAAQFIEGLRKQAEAEIEALKQSGWHGTASGKFAAAMSTWNTKMVGVRTELETIAQNLGQNAITYSANDEDVMAGVSRVDALINGSLRS
ncbi:WXG100 family type VII secretion target [Streptosporangium sp. CA-135522]|uniref:WXG100 family type VII secretion target n=1 Tax=Streptosporangium sp. CA-135522 TaxID=3240072 RepID=UPI003D90866A